MPKKFNGPRMERRFGQDQESTPLSPNMKKALAGAVVGGSVLTVISSLAKHKASSSSQASSPASSPFPVGTVGTKMRYVYPDSFSALNKLWDTGRINQRPGGKWTSLPKGVAYYNGPLPKQLKMGTPQRLQVRMDTILQVRTTARFAKLIQIYGREAQAGTYIDWEAVARGWDGVEISLPAEATGLHRLDNAWYSGWDVYPRGFVWNALAISPA
jgi:hypothetical protein